MTLQTEKLHIDYFRPRKRSHHFWLFQSLFDFELEPHTGETNGPGASFKKEGGGWRDLRTFSPPHLSPKNVLLIFSL